RCGHRCALGVAVKMRDKTGNFDFLVCVLDLPTVGQSAFLACVLNLPGYVSQRREIICRLSAGCSVFNFLRLAYLRYCCVEFRQGREESLPGLLGVVLALQFHQLCQLVNIQVLTYSKGKKLIRGSWMRYLCFLTF